MPRVAHWNNANKKNEKKLKDEVKRIDKVKEKLKTYASWFAPRGNYTGIVQPDDMKNIEEALKYMSKDDKLPDEFKETFYKWGSAHLPPQLTVGTPEQFGQIFVDVIQNDNYRVLDIINSIYIDNLIDLPNVSIETIFVKNNGDDSFGFFDNGKYYYFPKPRDYSFREYSAYIDGTPYATGYSHPPSVGVKERLDNMTKGDLKKILMFNDVNNYTLPKQSAPPKTMASIVFGLTSESSDNISDQIIASLNCVKNNSAIDLTKLKNLTGGDPYDPLGKTYTTLIGTLKKEIDVFHHVLVLIIIFVKIINKLCDVYKNAVEKYGKYYNKNNANRKVLDNMVKDTLSEIDQLKSITNETFGGSDLPLTPKGDYIEFVEEMRKNFLKGKYFVIKNNVLDVPESEKKIIEYIRSTNISFGGIRFKENGKLFPTNFRRTVTNQLFIVDDQISKNKEELKKLYLKKRTSLDKIDESMVSGNAMVLLLIFVKYYAESRKDEEFAKKFHEEFTGKLKKIIINSARMTDFRRNKSENNEMNREKDKLKMKELTKYFLEYLERLTRVKTYEKNNKIANKIDLLLNDIDNINIYFHNYFSNILNGVKSIRKYDELSDIIGAVEFNKLNKMLSDYDAEKGINEKKTKLIEIAKFLESPNRIKKIISNNVNTNRKDYEAIKMKIMSIIGQYIMIIDIYLELARLLQFFNSKPVMKIAFQNKINGLKQSKRNKLYIWTMEVYTGTVKSSFKTETFDATKGDFWIEKEKKFNDTIHTTTGVYNRVYLPLRHEGSLWFIDLFYFLTSSKETILDAYKEWTSYVENKNNVNQRWFKNHVPPIFAYDGDMASVRALNYFVGNEPSPFGSNKIITNSRQRTSFITDIYVEDKKEPKIVEPLLVTDLVEPQKFDWLLCWNLNSVLNTTTERFRFEIAQLIKLNGKYVGKNCKKEQGTYKKLYESLAKHLFGDNYNNIAKTKKGQLDAFIAQKMSGKFNGGLGTITWQKCRDLMGIQIMKK